MTRAPSSLSTRERAILEGNRRRRAMFEKTKTGTPSSQTLERRRRRKAKPKL